MQAPAPLLPRCLLPHRPLLPPYPQSLDGADPNVGWLHQAIAGWSRADLPEPRWCSPWPPPDLRALGFGWPHLLHLEILFHQLSGRVDNKVLPVIQGDLGRLH
jgi:hypothetical protein